MSYRRKRSWLPALLPAALLAGCAVDGIPAPDDAAIPGRQITQNPPSTDYTVFYQNALRACLQTGRSEWECKSGEDRFVRDALAVEAEINAQRRQRRAELRARSTIPGGDGNDEPGPRAVSTRLSQSVMFESQHRSHEPTVPMMIPADLELDLTSSETPAERR